MWILPWNSCSSTCQTPNNHLLRQTTHLTVITASISIVVIINMFRHNHQASSSSSHWAAQSPKLTRVTGSSTLRKITLFKSLELSRSRHHLISGCFSSRASNSPTSCPGLLWPRRHHTLTSTIKKKLKQRSPGRQKSFPFLSSTLFFCDLQHLWALSLCSAPREFPRFLFSCFVALTPTILASWLAHHFPMCFLTSNLLTLSGALSAFWRASERLPSRHTESPYSLGQCLSRRIKVRNCAFEQDFLRLSPSLEYGCRSAWFCTLKQ